MVARFGRLITYNPPAAGDKCYDPSRHEAAYVCGCGYGRDCGDGRQGERTLEYSDPKSEPEYVHQVDAVAEFRHAGYECRCRGAAYAGEEQEGAGGEGDAVDRTHRPSDLYYGCRVYYARHGLHVEREYRSHGACRHEYESRDEAATAAPREVFAYVVGYDGVSEVSREIPQHVVFVPEALAPHLAAPAVKIGYACRDEEQQDEEPLLACCGAFEPRRDYGDEEIYAYERVHEPQMSCQRWEVQQQPREVACRCCGVDLPPEQRQGAVEYHEDKERRQYAFCAAAVELPRGLCGGHGHEQICRDDDEQRHRHTRETIVERYPQAVCLVGQKRLRARHVGRAGCAVEVLAGVYQHHKKACEDAQIVQKDDPRLLCLGLWVHFVIMSYGFNLLPSCMARAGEGLFLLPCLSRTGVDSFYSMLSPCRLGPLAAINVFRTPL